jgi:hypothetical protein
MLHCGWLYLVKESPQKGSIAEARLCHMCLLVGFLLNKVDMLLPPVKADNELCGTSSYLSHPPASQNV